MKKLKKERVKFNREYLKPLLGCGILFVLIVVFMIIFGYNPSEKNDNQKKTEYYHLNISDTSVDQNSKCDSTFYNSVIENVNKIDVNFKIIQKEGENVLDEEASGEAGEDVYITRQYNAFAVNINNIPDQISIIVTDNKTENVHTLTKSENTFDALYVNDIVTYDVKVYGDMDSCKNVLLRQFTFKTPAINPYAQLILCQNNEDKNCDQVIYDSVDISDLSIKEYIKNTSSSEEEKKDNSIIKIVIASIAIVVIICVVFFIYFQRRKKRMVM